MNAKPEVLALLNAGKDTVNSTKQAVEFGLKKDKRRSFTPCSFLKISRLQAPKFSPIIT